MILPASGLALSHKGSVKWYCIVLYAMGCSQRKNPGAENPCARHFSHRKVPAAGKPQHVGFSQGKPQQGKHLALCAAVTEKNNNNPVAENPCVMYHSKKKTLQQ